MPDERRYQDEEVAEIFETAASSQVRGPTPGAPAAGLTLAELQAIGTEVGIPADRIADAARALDARRSALPRRYHLGMPMAVGRIADLPRAPTDREWDLMLAECRATFRAHGQDVSRGSVRGWRNGNLHAYVEPADEGYRLRLGSLKGDATAVTMLGAAGILLGLVIFLVLLATGDLAAELVKPLVLILLGGGTLGYNALRLPGWAREREEQMEEVAARARELLGSGPTP
jgi:hypothetical protein